jgi:hypothetical protein
MKPMRNMKAAVAGIVALVALAATPAAAREPLACIAASDPKDAGTALSAEPSLEFYIDSGSPLQSYSVTLTRVQSDSGSDGRLHNAYRAGAAKAIGATIVFAGETPVTFTVVALGHTYASLGRNEEETTFMADAVPGVACYTVEEEASPL